MDSLMAGNEVHITVEKLGLWLLCCVLQSGIHIKYPKQRSSDTVRLCV